MKSLTIASVVGAPVCTAALLLACVGCAENNRQYSRGYDDASASRARMIQPGDDQMALNVAMAHADYPYNTSYDSRYDSTATRRTTDSKQQASTYYDGQKRTDSQVKTDSQNRYDAQQSAQLDEQRARDQARTRDEQRIADSSRNDPSRNWDNSRNDATSRDGTYRNSANAQQDASRLGGGTVTDGRQWDPNRNGQRNPNLNDGSNNAVYTTANSSQAERDARQAQTNTNRTTTPAGVQPYTETNSEGLPTSPAARRQPTDNPTQPKGPEAARTAADMASDKNGVAMSPAARKQPTDNPTAIQNRDNSKAVNRDQAAMDRDMNANWALSPATSDNEILAAIMAIDLGEVVAASFAKQETLDPQVASYAKMMKDMHGKHLCDTMKLSNKLGIEPTCTPMVEVIEKKGVEGLTALSQLDGAAFQSAYVQSAIKCHSEVLAAIDQNLTKAVNNSEVRQHLAEMRTVVADHLAKAKALPIARDSARTDATTKAE